MNESKKLIIAFDGKVLRGSYRNDKKTSLQLVTAYDIECCLVLSQKPEPTENKNAEVSAVRQLLDVINVKDSVITVYVLHCQCDTLDKIAEKNAHVIVQVKNNQPKFRAAVVAQFQAVFDAGKKES